MASLVSTATFMDARVAFVGSTLTFMDARVVTRDLRSREPNIASGFFLGQGKKLLILRVREQSSEAN